MDRIKIHRTESDHKIGSKRRSFKDRKIQNSLFYAGFRLDHPGRFYSGLGLLMENWII